MKSAGLNSFITPALFCGLCCPVPSFCEESGDCKGVASEIVKFANASDIKKISVLDFAARGGVEKNETDYISEKMGSCLAGHKTPALIERALLEKVLKEARLSSSADGEADKAKALGGIFSIDAVVTGTVFAAGGKLKILTRLIDVKTGRVLLAVRSEAEREWAQFSGLPDMGLPWADADWPSLPSDFRDAVSEPARNSCADRKLRLTRLNSELVDAKALYWAAKMKEPGFSIRGLTKNPGTEITDPEIKARFYRLLGAYYRSESAPPPEQEKLPALMELLEEEAQVYNECGQRR